MRTTVRLALLVFAQCIWKAIAFQHKIGILADVQLGFPETDKLAAVAVMVCCASIGISCISFVRDIPVSFVASSKLGACLQACRHIQNRDMRL
eukprot:2949698-Rhodomonas_salina.1